MYHFSGKEPFGTIYNKRVSLKNTPKKPEQNCLKKQIQYENKREYNIGYT